MSKDKRKKLIEKYKTLDVSTKQEKKKILDRLAKEGFLIVDDNIQSESNLCIILSCPGQEELIKDKVCAGETGDNLDKVLKFVGLDHFRPGVEDKNGCRYAYTIVNAVNEVHFREYNGAEANENQIKEKSNIDRVKSELNDKIDYFLICGNNAAVLYDLIKSEYKDAKQSYVRHLGWVGLRNEYKNSSKELSDITKAADRDRKRLELVAEQIKKDFGF